MLLSDGGEIALTFADDRHSTAKWSTLGVDAQSFAEISPANFDVVDLGREIPAHLRLRAQPLTSHRSAWSSTACSTGGTRSSSMGPDQQPREPLLVAAARAQEPMQVFVRATVALGGLATQRPQRPQLAVPRDHLLDARHAERPDQLVLQVVDAHADAVLGAGRRVGRPAPGRTTQPPPRRTAHPTARRGLPTVGTKWPTLVAPPIATTATPPSARSWPRRRASSASAARSLTPSTSTTARGATSDTALILPWTLVGGGFGASPTSWASREPSCKVAARSRVVDWLHAGLRPVSEGSLGAAGRHARPAVPALLWFRAGTASVAAGHRRDRVSAPEGTWRSSRDSS